MYANGHAGGSWEALVQRAWFDLAGRRPGQVVRSAGRTRTYNQWINSPLLYQLSYRGRVPTGVGKATSGVFLA